MANAGEGGGEDNLVPRVFSGKGPGNEVGGRNQYKVLYEESLPRGPAPCPFEYHLDRKGTPFVYLYLKKSSPFHILYNWPVL